MLDGDWKINMTSNSSDILQSYIPVYDAIPENWDDSKQFLTESLKEISNAINQREIGFYLDEELLTGKSFFPGTTAPGNNPGVFRSILRKVVDFGALPNTNIKSVPHGILFDINFSLIQIWGAATNPITFQAIPIPYTEVQVPALGNIQLTMDSTNVNIVTASNRSAFTRCFVIIEYIQEL